MINELKKYPDSTGNWKCADTFFDSVALFKVIEREGQLICIGADTGAEFTQEYFQDDPFTFFAKVD